MFRGSRRGSSGPSHWFAGGPAGTAVRRPGEQDPVRGDHFGEAGEQGPNAVRHSCEAKPPQEGGRPREEEQRAEAPTRGGGGWQVATPGGGGGLELPAADRRLEEAYPTNAAY